MSPCHYWSLGDHANTVFPPGICTYTVFSPAKPFVLPLALVKYGFHPVLNEPAWYLTLAAIIVEWGAAV